jgi:hypothetical protein
MAGAEKKSATGGGASAARLVLPDKASSSATAIEAAALAGALAAFIEALMADGKAAGTARPRLNVLGMASLPGVMAIRAAGTQHSNQLTRTRPRHPSA